jgi:tRNA(adenine34) deaminase
MRSLKPNEIHRQYMGFAIELARKNPEAPFGAILVDSKTGKIMAEGINRWRENPVLHGEIDAIMKLGQLSAEVPWSQLALYTTAEPCCMCMGAVLWTGIGTVVFGTSIATLIRLGWKQIDISAAEVLRRCHSASCELVPGVLEEECDALFRSARRTWQ